MRKYPTHFYEFGPFRLDVNERVLTRGNEKVPLTPKVFDTLLALVESQGRLVEKGELMAKVWPDSFVEEANLTQNISILRRALGEGSDARQFIETVPKRGYRFTADVRETKVENGALVVEQKTRSRILISDDEETAAPEKPALSSGPNRFLPERVSKALARIASPKPVTFQVRPATAVGIIVFAGLAVSLGVWGWMRPTPPGFMPQFTDRFDLAGEDSVSLSYSHLSPDNKFIAYARTTSGGLNIWITQMVGSDKQQITFGNHIDGSPI